MADIFFVSFLTAGISAVLAAIISVIDAIVNNYGDITIDINSGKKQLVVKGGSPLLSTLGKEKIYIPSSCGGRATCGVCKVKVTSNIGPHLPTELPFMNDEEKEMNIRLSCQIKLKQDISIDVPESLFAVQRFKTEVISLKNLCYDTKEVRLKLLEPNSISFKPGQFAQIVIPPYGKLKEQTIRAYSISSQPSHRNVLEFIIRQVPEGIATTYVHTKMHEGEQIDIIAPMGDFYVHDNTDIMICISGGSGMAPFKSILFDMFEKQIERKAVWYFHGGNTLRDMYNMELFQELEKKWPIFHFAPVLFKPNPQDNWQGETGLVTEGATNKFGKEINLAELADAYLCGSPGLIDASIKILTQAGLDASKIYYDKFA
ncbi:MAG: 2Fe-2S iron-sulfur cluster binding domain-containing protein [Spirochaetales bacterium]|nr:2Fe-2S iron-sulfur cluster binding domain-containing protein [Spirochaetales bacterium]